ncbi:MAG: hypothetical protein M9953_02945 [Thermomicrobiales bacterium]|nr:hypothetical protein [Thermomicrobiales bacterium]MCO5224273.1 hypothetical protein [Thermomicrobiales bacterium]MCO5229450.1 hypothetical protein [Thermomicrobiales bacterium]
MRPPVGARTACLLDAIGCAVGGVVLFISPTVWSWLALPESWRIPVALMLLLFAGLAAAAYQIGIRQMILAVVAGNVAWILAGAYALAVTESVVGGAIIGTVMVADAAMAWLQLSPR